MNEFCSIFDNNHASDGAAMNLAFYSAKFDNVTFRNNVESAIRVSLYVLNVRMENKHCNN